MRRRRGRSFERADDLGGAGSGGGDDEAALAMFVFVVVGRSFVGLSLCWLVGAFVREV